MKMICIGRNYAQHATELNNEIPKEPVVFIKPETALLKENVFTIPPFSNNINYEVELVLRISKKAKNVRLLDADQYFDSIALGIDFTARDIQMECKEKGLPWEKAKAFDGSAYVSNFIAKEKLPNENISFYLDRMPARRVQSGNSKNMLFSFTELVAYCSQYFTLNEGDFLFTGTPAGVGQVKNGEIYTGGIETNELFRIAIKS